MARSRKSSPKTSYAKKYAGKWSLGENSSKDDSKTTNLSTNDVASSMVSNFSPSSSSGTSNVNLRLSVSDRSAVAAGEEDVEQLGRNSLEAPDESCKSKNASAGCEANFVDELQSLPSPLCSHRNTSIWSARPSDVRKSGFVNKNISHLSNNCRRKTMAFGEIGDDLMEATPRTPVEDDLPPTQPSGPLKDVVAYVEVYSGAENRSMYIANAVRDLGATVSQRFTNKITHVIFREGLQSTVRKARSRNIPCVSVLWLDSCIKQNEKVCEDVYKIVDITSTGKPLIVGKLRKPKSMQPEPFDREVVLSDERVRRRAKCVETYRLMKEITNFNVALDSPTVDDAIKTSVLVSDTPAAASSCNDDSSPRQAIDWQALTDTFTPDSLRMQLNQLKNKFVGIIRASPEGSDDSSGEIGSLSANVKKRLFENGGILSGTPPPSFLVKPLQQRISRRQNFECGASPTLCSNRTKPCLVIPDSVQSDDAQATQKEKLNVFCEEMVKRTQSLDISTQDKCEPSPRVQPSNKAVEQTLVVQETPTESQEENVKVENVKTVAFSNYDGDWTPTVSESLRQLDKNDERRQSTKFLSPRKQNSWIVANVGGESDSTSVGSTHLVRRQSTSHTHKVHAAVNTEYRHENVSKSKRSRKRYVDYVRDSCAGENEDDGRSSVDLVIDNVCRQTFALEAEVCSVSKCQVSSNCGERKKHLFDENNEAPSFSSLSKSNEWSPNHEPTLMEKLKADCINANDLDDVFAPKFTSSYLATGRKVKRFRSSMFLVKTAFAAANELQRGKPSPEEFKAKEDQTAKVKSRRKTVAPTSGTAAVNKTSKRTRADSRRASLVITSVVGSVERDFVEEAVKRLGRFSLDKVVTERTTHVVCGDSRRTLSVLNGIVRGCWIISLDWIHRSVEAGGWIEEEKFVIQKFEASKIVRDLRKCTLLSSMGPIYVSSESKPPTEDLKTLIKLCSGKIATSIRRSDLCIGRPVDRENIKDIVVTESWLLDSISKQILLPFDSYLI